MSEAIAIDFGKCPRCGAVYLRADACPALCAPLPVPLPKYTGPEFIGRTHTARLSAPVYKPEDWIGLPTTEVG